MGIIRNINKTNIFFFIIVLLFVFFRLYYSDACFFWDAIASVSKPANFLYDNNFSFSYPDEFRTGDPQLLQSYLALSWIIFGKSLYVSHLAFLPIIVITLYQIFILCKKFIPNNCIIFSFMVLISEAAFMTQSLLLYYEMYIMLFSLISINSVLSDKKYLLATSLFFLTLVNQRAIIITAVIIVSYYFYTYVIKKEEISVKSFINKSYPIIPASISVIIFLVYRYYYFGMSLTHENSPWKESWRFVNLYGFIRNIVVYVWQYVDTARLFISFALFFIVLKYRKSRIDGDLKYLWFLFFLLNIAFLSVTLPFKNFFGSRYFVLHFFILNLILQVYLFKFLTQNKAKVLSLLLTFLLLSGNLWISFYPEKFSKNWDTSLAHLPYYELRRECFKYMENNGIAYSSVASSFNIYGNQKYIDLIPIDRVISGTMEQKDYYIYSNILNLDDTTIDNIHNADKWELEKKFKKGAVFMSIYKKVHND